MVKLGKKVTDKITGFTGIAIARCEYLNGCISIEVRPDRLQSDGSMFSTKWVDEQQLTEKSGAKAGGPQARPPSLSIPH